MFHQTTLRSLTLALLLLGALLYAAVASYYGLEILTEIAILAIVVVALDLVAGFGGMISLCHGALMGVGAYGFTMLAMHSGLPPVVAMLGAIVLTGVVGWVIGAICARSHGIYFIMATLAFGQMGYAFAFESPWFGGDDGLSGAPRPDLTMFGIDLFDGKSFALYCIVMLALVYAVAVWVLRSGLGRSLTGIMHNEQRMRALGLSIWRVKAAAFAVSGALAGVAGVLAAQHSMYVSPGIMSWMVSGEALVVVILGGLGTLVGPIVGAVFFVVLKHEVSSLTPYWHMVVGIILVAVVMSRANGIFGWLEERIELYRARRKPAVRLPVAGKKDIKSDA